MGNCKTMIFFEGRASFTPNTLNNNVWTYAFAHQWQKKNTFQMNQGIPQLKQRYTHPKWMDLIFSVNKFKKHWGGFRSNYMACFDDWQVNGDGMYLPEFRAVGVFNPRTDTSIRLFSEEEKFLITSKLGKQKAVLADQDTDSQTYSKMFAFAFKADDDMQVEFQPASFRYMNQRTANYDGPTTFQADFFLTGFSKPSYSSEFQEAGKKKNQYLKPLMNKGTLLRMNMHRFNQATKVGSCIGYIQDTDCPVNLPVFQGWREVILKKQPEKPNPLLIHRILFKSVSNGLLIDISNAISDHNTDELTPSYPKQYELTVTWPQTQISKKISVEEAIKTAGILFYPGSFQLPKGPIEEVKIVMNFDDQELIYKGKQQEFSLDTNDASMKNDVWGGHIPLSKTAYKNFIEMKVFCSRYGSPYNGELPLSISSNFGIDPKGLQDYGLEYQELIALMKGKIQSDPQFAKLYPSTEYIEENIYSGHLKEIVDTANTIKSKCQKSNDFYSWKSGTTNQVFKLVFLDENGGKVSKRTAKFINGEATVKIALNESLTDKNNPRYPWTESLALQGNIKIEKMQETKSTFIDFCCIFFQNEENPSLSEKNNIDWVHDVGPVLRKMALIYPAMQKIIDLYNFQGISIAAMKRAFDVEDENSARYMPSTREMSKLTHRKIRRWLYNPIFNKDAIFLPERRRKQRVTNVEFEEELLKPKYLLVQDFYKKKQKFVEKLIGAWKIEFFTIPLYLNALFTAPNKATKHLIRTVVVDEMKHLFIVSNALNALHDDELMGYTRAVPFYDKTALPKYPSHPPQVLHPEDLELKKMLKYQLLPCIPEQLLKFALIELPGETKNLRFQYLGDPASKKLNDLRHKRIEDLDNLIRKINTEQELNANFKTIGEFYAEIMNELWDLADLETYLNSKGESVQLFSGDPLNQFTYFGLENMSGIYDLRSCLNQFRLIVEEGQGENLFQVSGRMNKESHFIKFLEIYTMCDIDVRTEYEGSDESQIVFQFTDGKYRLAPEELAEKWTSKVVQETNKKIQREFSLQRESPGIEEDYEKNPSNPSYPSIYAPPAFTNAYEKLVEQLDYLFNTDFNTFKKSSRIKGMGKDEALKEYEVFRRKRMEDSIAKMKQMTLLSDKVIEPEGRQVKKVKHLGTKPSYEIDEEAKVFKKRIATAQE